jgi:hypothetical protein
VKGWVLIATLLSGLSAFALFHLHSFLALNEPVQADLLVVEGWMPGSVFRRAVQEFGSKQYRKVIATGGIPDKGRYSSDFASYAHHSANALVRLGLPRNVLSTVVSNPSIERETYNSAVALQKWLRDEHFAPGGINIVTGAPATRRTRLIYRRVLGPKLHIGVIAVERSGYDPRRWWSTSEGVRAVLDEALSYLYLRIYFSP